MEMYWEGPKYKDRHNAGLFLAEKLEPYHLQRPIILAIPNGGVAVALPIAKALACPLHLIVVRKLQIPDSPEAGFGSVASDGSLHLNEPLVRRLRITEETISQQKERALETIRTRLDRYGPAAAFPDLQDATAILVDTSSMSAHRRISPLVDRVICPDLSRLPIFAVADAYEHWRDLNDEEVIAMIQDGT